MTPGDPPATDRNHPESRSIPWHGMDRDGTKRNETESFGKFWNVPQRFATFLQTTILHNSLSGRH